MAKFTCRDYGFDYDFIAEGDDIAKGNRGIWKTFLWWTWNRIFQRGLDAVYFEEAWIKLILKIRRDYFLESLLTNHFLHLSHFVNSSFKLINKLPQEEHWLIFQCKKYLVIMIKFSPKYTITVVKNETVFLQQVVWHFSQNW